MKYYNAANDWYVIQNPGAIARWASVNDQLKQDLQNEVRVANDPAFSAKAAQTTAAIDAENQAEGKKEFLNGRARISNCRDILARDPNKILSIPAISILSAIAVADPAKLTADRAKFGIESSAARVLLDPEIPWSDVEPLMKQVSSLKQTFLTIIKDHFHQRDPKQKPLKNYEVMLMIASLEPARFPAPMPSEIVDLYVTTTELKSGSKAIGSFFLRDQGGIPDSHARANFESEGDGEPEYLDPGLHVCAQQFSRRRSSATLFAESKIVVSGAIDV